MKQRDAEKLARATEALVDRIRACVDKLSAREKIVLAALEPLAAINETLEKEVGKWDDLTGDLDPDAEVAPNADAPAIDIDDLTTTIEGAFEAAHSTLEESISFFEDIIGNARAYEEPEEEEEEEVVYACSCDHPRCVAEGPERPTDAGAQQAAREAGWLVTDEGNYCPKHHPAPAEKGEHFGCRSQGCEAESPGRDTLDEAEEAALEAGWKFDSEGWPYCPRHRSEV